ncbi:MAG: peptidoglycan DD-metalloendopeptidase family protein [Eubacteriales bacterium]|nr:peptidoglycan DD-metalloendopeptidase family protein [Eubacteriales bacterium]
MIKKLHNFLKANIDITVCVIIISAAFSLSLFYTGNNNIKAYELHENSYAPVVYAVSEETVSADEETLYGYTLYINGEKICSSKDDDTIEMLLEDTAENQACASYGYIVSVEIQDDIYYGYTVLDTVDEEEDIIESLAGYQLSLLVETLEQRNAELSYSTVYIDDSEAYEGTEKVLQKGSNGIAENLYVITYCDGVKAEEKLFVSIVTQEPVEEIVKRGIKVKSATVLTGLKMFIMPYDGGITSEYGTRYLLGGTFHGGVDIAAKEPGGYCYGDYIKAAGDGVVVFAEMSGDFGNLTIIEHSNGIRTYYAHQSEILVKVGSEVKQGEYIGLIGSTGKSTGPHLHFEVRLPDGDGDYYRVNPKNYIIDYESYYR